METETQAKGAPEQDLAIAALGPALVLRPQPRRWIVWPVVGALVVLAFGLIVRELPQFTAAEYRIDGVLAQHRTRFLDWLALGLNDIFGIAFGPWLVTGGAVFFVARQRGLSALALVVSIGAGCASCWLMKLLVARHSPTTEPVWISYPSGHVVFAASLGIAAYWLFSETRWRRPVLLGSVLMVAVVAWSRLYLGVHYPTDVLASCLLTLAAAGFAAGAWNEYMPKLLRLAPQLRQDI